MRSYTLKRLILCNFLLAAIYAATAIAGLKFATISNSASPIWPASGLAVFCLIRFGSSLWLGVFVGAFLANLTTGAPLTAVIGISIGNTLEGLLGLWICQRLNRSDNTGRLDLLSYLSVAVVATSASATFGVTSLSLHKVIPWNLYWQVWVTWWSGDALGVLVFTPLLMLFDAKRESKEPRNLVRDLGFILLSVLVPALSFANFQDSAFLFLCLPVLLLIATYSDDFIGSVCLLLMCITAVWYTLEGKGPFVQGSQNDKLLNLQIFLAILSITTRGLFFFKKKQVLSHISYYLAGGWLLSALISHVFNVHQMKKEEATLDRLVVQSTTAIQERFAKFEEALHAGAGLRAILNKHIDRETWRRFIDQMGSFERYPGMRGFGLIYQVETNKYVSHYEKSKLLGYPEYVIHPVPGFETYSSPEHYVISAIEPFENNRSALGLDLASEENRRVALELARDSGKTVLSKKIFLIQDSKKRPANLVFIPIYKSAEELVTVQERRKTFIGWSYAPFVTEDFFNGIEGIRRNELDLFVFDSPTNDPDELIYSPAGKALPSVADRATDIVLGGRHLGLAWKKTPLFPSNFDTFSSIVVGMCSLITLLIASVVGSAKMLYVRAQNIAEDLTRSLKERENELEEVQKLAKIGGFWFSPATHKGHCSKELSVLYGRKAEQELPPDDFLKLIHPEDVNRVQGSMRLSAQGACTKEHFRMILPNGTLRHFNVSSVAELDEKGAVTRVRGTVQDVTESVLIQSELEMQRQKLIASSKMSALGEMAAGVSHEINNPLAIIMGTANAVRRALAKGKLDAEAVESYMAKIEFTVERIAKIVKGLKSFSRNAENDPMKMAQLSNILENTLELCSEKMKKRGIDVRTKNISGASLECREVQIEQVLLNLLNNAADAVETLPEKWIEIAFEEKKSFLEISVMDSGLGISPEIADKIMQPFFTTKDVDKGTGLGLSVSQGIIAQHNGKLWLDRTSKHTRFVIRVPRFQTASDQTKQAA